MYSHSDITLARVERRGSCEYQCMIQHAVNEMLEILHSGIFECNISEWINTINLNSSVQYFGSTDRL